MKRLTAEDIDQELLDLYDYYAHGMITKREFLDRSAKFAVGGVTAVALFDMMKPVKAPTIKTSPWAKLIS